MHTRVWRKKYKCPFPGFSSSFCSLEGLRAISRPHQTPVRTKLRLKRFPIFQSVKKATFLTLRVATPLVAPRQAPLEVLSPCIREGKGIWESETVAANRVAAINPPIDDTDSIRKFSIDPGKPHGSAKPNRILSKREADTEFQYRPYIVDTEIDCRRRFCGGHVRDA